MLSRLHHQRTPFTIKLSSCSRVHDCFDAANKKSQFKTGKTPKQIALCTILRLSPYYIYVNSTLTPSRLKHTHDPDLVHIQIHSKATTIESKIESRDNILIRLVPVFLFFIIIFRPFYPNY